MKMFLIVLMFASVAFSASSSGQKCVCADNWSSPEDGAGCMDQTGCTLCDHGDIENDPNPAYWCMVTVENCFGAEQPDGDWAYCDPKIEQPEPQKIASTDTNDGQGWPCKKNGQRQYRKCKGKSKDVPEIDNQRDCFDACKEYGYFTWNHDSQRCRCSKCTKGIKKYGNFATAIYPIPNLDSTDRLYKCTYEKGLCASTEESGNACELGNAPDGTRCVKDEECQSKKCCPNFKVCGTAHGGYTPAVNGKQWDPNANKFSAPIDWDNWSCTHPHLLHKEHVKTNVKLSVYQFVFLIMGVTTVVLTLITFFTWYFAVRGKNGIELHNNYDLVMEEQA